jgi:hypothetical protein
LNVRVAAERVRGREVEGRLVDDESRILGAAGVAEVEVAVGGEAWVTVTSIELGVTEAHGASSRSVKSGSWSCCRRGSRRGAVTGDVTRSS